MGDVDFDFKSSFPAFDANVSIGRSMVRRVTMDSVGELIRAMDSCGVGKALVHSPHAIECDTFDGNNDIVNVTKENNRLVPQFVANPGIDHLESFKSSTLSSGVKSVRFDPGANNYPFVEWMVGSWLDWLSSACIPAWIPVTDVDPSEMHDTISGHSDLSIVLCEVHYKHIPWLMPLLKSLPNVYVEISRFVITDGVKRLINAVGAGRVLFGSRFPESSMGHQLYNLHRNGLSDSDLEAICKCNLESLLYPVK
jgi:hypothetical protein